MRLVGVTLTYNEAALVPYVMPYIEKLGYDRFVVYDNESTDNTVELLKQYPFVEIRSFHTDKMDNYQHIKNMLEIYQEEFKISYGKGEPVWMTMGDFDEVFYFTHWKTMYTINKEPFKFYLNNLSELGYNVCTEEIVDLISENMPVLKDSHDLVHNHIDKFNYGHPFEWNKPVLFRVDNLEALSFFGGMHYGKFRFEGQKITPFYGTKYLFRFHLKYIGKDRLYANNVERNRKRGNTNCPIEDFNERWDSVVSEGLPLKDYIKDKKLHGTLQYDIEYAARSL